MSAPVNWFGRWPSLADYLRQQQDGLDRHGYAALYQQQPVLPETTAIRDVPFMRRPVVAVSTRAMPPRPRGDRHG